MNSTEKKTLKLLLEAISNAKDVSERAVAVQTYNDFIYAVQNRISLDQLIEEIKSEQNVEEK